MNQTFNVHRLTGPDYAKMIAIALVVLGHTFRGLVNADLVESQGFWLYLDRGIYLFHMPLFFFISGLFISHIAQRETLFSIVKRNIILLIIPLIFWSYLQIGIQYAAGSSVNNPLSIYHVIWAPYPPKFQFWFLSALFIIACFAAAILKLKKGPYILAILSISTIIALSIGHLMNADFAEYKQADIKLAGDAIFFMPYYALGLFVPAIALIRRNKGFLLSLFAFSTSVTIYLHFYQEANWFYYLFSFICVFTAYQIAAFVGEKVESYVQSHDPMKMTWLHNAILFIGMNSMIIFLAHVIAEAGTRVILLKLGITNLHLHLIAGVFTGLFCPLLLVPLNIFISRYFPTITQTLIPVKFFRKQANV